MTQEESLYERIEAAGHRLRRLSDGSVDPHVLDQEDEQDGVWVNWHYGPGCEVCWDSWCQNCNPEHIKPCKGHP